MVSPAKRTARGIALGLAALLSISAFLVPGAPALAADARQFNPGNIISDEQFYNGSAMTAQEVQSFLQAKVPRCTIGDPGRAPGSKFGNTTVAQNCLRDLKLATASKPSNPYCSSYAGSPNESAAQIITKVGRACNISQQALLVLLQKEQSLITDDWPTNLQYRSATGYGCPDTAPCDAEYYGFFNQVYRAAWTFNYYRANPAQYNYRPGRNNTIYWHPNASCGTSQVYIENSATAGLYIYTPYRPNQAALNAGFGSGDNCSTYGNRNFFLYFSDWFGSKQVTVHPKIQPFYTEVGDAYGKPLRNAVSIDKSGSVSQEFTNGTYYWSPSGGVSVLTGGIRSFYDNQGGSFGYLKYPLRTQLRYPDGTLFQDFTGGTVYWRPSLPTTAVSGGIRSFYISAGGHTGYLGYPTTNIIAGPRESYSQDFQGGSIYWQAHGKAAVVTGGIKTHYLSLRGPNGFLGFPEEPQKGHPDGSWTQRFQGGVIYWQPNGTTSAVTGGILSYYLKENGSSGPLGYPMAAQQGFPDGSWTQEFQNGTVYWQPSGTTSRVAGDIQAYYLSQGGSSGFLRFPIGSGSLRADGVSTQDFQGGTAYAGAGVPGAAVSGGIRTRFFGEGGPDGALGYPTAPMAGMNDNSWSQQFTHGGIYWQPSGVSFLVTGSIRDTYVTEGGPGGYLKAPRAAAKQGPAGTSSQEFAGGTIYRNATGEAYPISGGVRAFYLARGGPGGTLGLPTGKMAYRADGAWVQAFAGGTVVWKSANEAWIDPLPPRQTQLSGTEDADADESSPAGEAGSNASDPAEPTDTTTP